MTTQTLEPRAVALDDNTAWPALVLVVDGVVEDWKGWLIPYLDRRALESWLAIPDTGMTSEWDGDVLLLFQSDDPGIPIRIEPEQVDGRAYWRLDIGWIFTDASTHEGWDGR